LRTSFETPGARMIGALSLDCQEFLASAEAEDPAGACHLLGVRAARVADHEGWLQDRAAGGGRPGGGLRVGGGGARREQGEEGRDADAGSHVPRALEGEACLLAGALGASALGKRKAEDEEAARAHRPPRRRAVVADVTSQLEAGVRPLRVTRDDPRAR